MILKRYTINRLNLIKTITLCNNTILDDKKNRLIKMGKNKGTRITITLECSCGAQGTNSTRKNGIMRYTTSKNRRNNPNRLELKKFCPPCNKHSIFKEIK